MKLKYYLRGVGIGIIFATLVMTVSSLMHKYNITDEYIIKEARKLGMVMRDEINNNSGLLGKDDAEETQDTQGSESESQIQPSESESQTPPPSESESQTPPPSESESQTPSPSESESQTPPPSESESQTPPPSESEPQTPPPSESESQEPPASEEKKYVTVTIVRGDYARQVAEKVRDAGLIEDAEDFRKYIGRQGYGQLFHAGTYKIPIGADYEEICQILISR